MICVGGLGGTHHMTVSQHHSGGTIAYSDLCYLTGKQCARGQIPFINQITAHNLPLGIHAQHICHLISRTEEIWTQPVCVIKGITQHIAAGRTVDVIPTGDLGQHMDEQGSVLPNARHLHKIGNRSVKDASQGAKVVDQTVCQRVGIPLWDGVKEEKFQQLMVLKRHFTVAKKTVL